MSAPEHDVSRPQAETPDETCRDRTVLIVDDVPYLLDVASLFLGRSSRVETATGGLAGLAAARRLRPDLVLCDDCMPDLDGLDLCREIRNDPDLAHTPVVMLLSDSSAATHGAAIRAGANDVLTKPLERLTLVAAVTRFLSHSPTRGLPRIDTQVPVTVVGNGNEGPGTVVNVSRGGAFVETDVPLVCADEIGLRFQLPGSPLTLRPSAEVVWQRHHYETETETETETGLGGVGLRFVEIDAPSARALDEFVYEHRNTFDGAPWR